MNGLYEFYASDLRPILIDQERRRKKALQSKVFYPVAFIAATLLILFWLKFGVYLSTTNLLITAFVIYLFTIPRTVLRTHRVYVKKTTLSKVVNFIDTDLHYDAEGMVPLENLAASGFFDSAAISNIKGEDLIAGTLNDMPFACSEIRLKRISRKVNARIETSHGVFVVPRPSIDTPFDLINEISINGQGFHGLFAVIKLPKRIDDVIYIFPNNRGGKVNRRATTFAKLERIKLEDPVFERYFNAYGTDQVKSRMLLTTKLIEDITKLRQKMDGSIMLSMKNDKLYIAVASSKDLFEPNVFESYLTPKHIRTYLRELEIVTQLVEDVRVIFKSEIA